MSDDPFLEVERLIEMAMVRIRHQLEDAHKAAHLGDGQDFDLALGCAEGLIEELRQEASKRGIAR